MCLYPKLIQNKKYTANKKNGGVIPHFNDPRVLHVAAGCGKCIECMRQKANNWKTRLMEDIKDNPKCTFVTLTFSNEKLTELNEEIPEQIQGYARDNAIATLAVRRFLERWRKKNKKSIRHWLVTELGHKGTENIHLHGLIYTKDTAEIHKHWQYGYCYYGSYVNQRTVNYIVKYITKTDVQHRYYKPIVLCSKGIGSGYTKRAVSKDNQYKNEQTRDYYRTEQGYKLALPIYWRNKLYTDEQREQLWINRLNEEARYVLGQKVSIAKNPFTYFKLVDEARKLNAQLGYGNNKIDWNRKNYEEQLRQQQLMTRTYNNNKNNSQ